MYSDLPGPRFRSQTLSYVFNGGAIVSFFLSFNFVFIVYTITDVPSSPFFGHSPVVDVEFSFSLF